MSRNLIIATTIALSSAFIPLTINAAQTTDSIDMTKDAWLSQMSPILPDVICKGFIEDADLKKRFDDLKINYDKCLGYIPAISTKCQGQIYASIPEKINDASAATWGRTLGECIGKNFAEQYLLPK